MTNNNHQVVQENSHESSLSYVVYKVAEDKENKNRRNLYRAESPRVPENFRQDPPMKLFAKNIHSIKFSAWDGQKWRKEKWDSTKKETKNKLATRARFKDSVDFIGWYTDKTEKLLKISKKDAYRQYLAYHEGWGNYKNYKNNQKVIILAKKVAEQANKYRKQLMKCQKRLNKNKYIIF